MSKFSPINLKSWVDANRHFLKPPVGNKCIWENREFIVMVVGGPNERTDYHVNKGEEFFYQLEGDIVLKVIDEGKAIEIAIREGEIFLLPPNTPHSPRRPENTVGLVIERKRLSQEKSVDALRAMLEKADRKTFDEASETLQKLQDVVEEKDGLLWYCEQCGEKLYEEYFHLTDVATQFQPIFDRFYASNASTCKKCGASAKPLVR